MYTITEEAKHLRHTEIKQDVAVFMLLSLDTGSRYV